MTVYTFGRDNIVARLPADLARPTGGKCSCPYCKAHTDQASKWDAVNLTSEPFPIHWPDMETEAPFQSRPPTDEERRKFNLYCKQLRARMFPAGNVHPCG